MTIEEIPAAELEKNRSLYREIARRALLLYEQGRFESCLRWITLAATYAWFHHPGFFADGQIENLALEIGKKLDEQKPADGPRLPAAFAASSPKQKVIHIVTSVFSVGGHTRLLRNWVTYFSDYEHHLLVTHLAGGEVPTFLSEAIEQSGGSILVLTPDASLLQKAAWVRRAVSPDFEYVILHDNPSDIVPIVALADANCPPVAAVDHADHVFWLGSSVADLVVDFCRSGEERSLAKRFAKKTTVVPYLLELDTPVISRDEARRSLGIDKDETILITMGNPYKYRPTEKHNFFTTAQAILERHPRARLYFVGLTENEAPTRSHRMVFLGAQDDPVLYQIAADIYLDGFPNGGGMASVGTTVLGACPVFAYAQPSIATARRLLEFESEVPKLDSEEAYIEHVSDLILHPRRRKDIVGRLQKRHPFAA